MESALNIVLVAVGLVALCYGGSWLVSGGVMVAKRMGLSPLVIGMTVVAYGTSTPELAASLATGGEHGALVLGNIVGSNIANVGLVIGVAAIIVPLAIGRKTLIREIPIMIGFSALLVAVSLDGILSIEDGLILVAALVAFTVYICKTARNKDEVQHTESVSGSIPKALAAILVGIGTLYIGSVVTIDNAVSIAQSFGITERVIGITVIAIGTSLPELVTSIIAIRRKEEKIGIGNIIGSNIYNVLMIAGVSSALFTIGVDSKVFADYAIMIAFSAALFVALRSKKIGRGMGAVLVAAYIIYLATVAY